MFLKAGGGVWSAAGTWSATGQAGVDSVGPPLASTDCIAEASSGALTIDAGAVCRSFDCTSGTGAYTGTVTHTAAVVLTIGDATAGAGNVALKLAPGMTYTLGASTSQITFASTSTTQQSITTATKALGTVIINGVAGSWLMADAMVTGNATFSITNGTFNTGSFGLTTGAISTSAGTTLTLGTSIVTLLRTAAGAVWTMSASCTFSGASSTIIVSTISANSRTFTGSAKTYGTLTYTVAGSTGALVIVSANTFATINFSDVTNARTLTLPSATTTTITTAFTVNGTAGKLMTINASSGGSAATLSKVSGTVTCDYCSIQDSTVTGGATWNATNSTNVSGNTGWNFGASEHGVSGLGGGYDLLHEPSILIRSAHKWKGIRG